MKKVISYLLILVVAAQMFSIVAFAATSTKYTAELSFQGQHTGETREYTGRDMHWSGTTEETYSEPEYPDVFYVYLYRKNLFGSTQLGDGIECPRNGFHNLAWYGVGSGKYYFFYSKARDGANVESERITMEMTP